MSINQLLLWEKYRPKTFEDTILLPRIRKQFENGVSQHYIFYGHYGTGKTSLARILIGKYSKQTPFLEINCSLDTSIDTLRTEIDDFCKFSPMMEIDSDIKFILLEEFERVSPQFQDGFKAFIEKYNKKVRFIITTNHINKISDGLKSRIKKINFDFETIDEEKYLKSEIGKRIFNLISKKEDKEISKEKILELINKNFPDIRSTLVELQSFFEIGENANINSISNSEKLVLYNMLYDTNDYEKTYHFLMFNFGADKIDTMLKLLGKPFIEWVFTEKRNDVEKLFQINKLVTDYTFKLDSQIDPIILGMSIIGEIKQILK